MISEAQREANKRYKKKIAQKQIEYYTQELEEYQRIEQHCKEMDISYQRYVKDLIRKDMERMEKERGDNQNGTESQ